MIQIRARDPGVVLRARASRGRARPAQPRHQREVLFSTLPSVLGAMTHVWNTTKGDAQRSADAYAAIRRELDRLLQVPLAEDAMQSFRPLLVTMRAAMEDLASQLEGMRAVQSVTQELRQAIEDRAELERLLRDADPIDATILRHQFSGDNRHEAVPAGRLPLEHPLVLADQTEASIYQRASRAYKRLKASRKTFRARPKAITLFDLLLASEGTHA